MNARPVPRRTRTRTRVRVAVLTGLALLCGSAWADADTPLTSAFEAQRLWLNAGFYSAHFDTHKDLRNANPGLGFEYRLNDHWSATAGRFINSDSAHSSYVGTYYQPWTVAGVKLGVVAGTFNGYPKAFNGDWFPAVLPVASWEGERFGLNVALVPPLKDRPYGAVSFQLKVRLGK